ncbi:myosin heavy chain [Labeo rohita]|uniref:Myosin heavy chain n=1 Tax=Labeo rohita TaxID=84645 RepID=A0A498P1S0_LABRO|nr:myosin heavy chain [Labeo rohita]
MYPDLCGADLLSSLDNVANYDDTLIKGWDACDDAVVPNASEAITRSVVTDKPSGITCADNFVADIDDQDLISAADSIAPVPVTSTSSPISMEDLTYKQIELYGPPRPEAQVTIIDLMHKEFSIDPHGMIIDLTHKESSDDQDGPSISNADRRNERSPLRTKRIVAVVNPTINNAASDSDISVGNDTPENEIIQDRQRDTSDDTTNWTESQMRDWETASWGNSPQRGGRQTTFTIQEPVGREEDLTECILTSKNLVQSLFPMLTKAVKKNKAILAVKFLGKAQVWIKEIISEVDRIVEKYEVHSKDVASYTSDVIKKKSDIDKKITEQDLEM